VERRAEDIVEGADPITDLALRVIGARIGTTVSPDGSGISNCGSGWF
jgi:hypothetical protein